MNAWLGEAAAGDLTRLAPLLSGLELRMIG